MGMSGDPRRSIGNDRRHLLAVTAFALMGCLDLTVPPNVGEDGGPDVALDAPIQTAGGAGAEGGSGGQGGGGGISARDAEGLADSRWDGADDSGKGGAGGSGDATATGAQDGSDEAFAGSTDGGRGGLDGGADEGVGMDSGAPDASTDTGTDATASDGPRFPLQAGLVVYYPCEELEGTMLRDRSGNENHGTLLAASGSSGAGYKIDYGKIGNALTLMQSGSGYVSLPPTAFQGSADLTIATWVKINSLASWQRLLDVGLNANLPQNTANDTVYMALFMKNLGSKLGLTSTKDGFSTAQQVTADTLPTGTWKHVAAVLSAGAVTLYIDGTATSMVNPFLPPQELGTLDYAFLGKSQFSSDPYLDAQIDEFRVYNRALSASEVQALVLFAGPAGPSPAPPN